MYARRAAVNTPRIDQLLSVNQAIDQSADSASSVGPLLEKTVSICRKRERITRVCQRAKGTWSELRMYCNVIVTVKKEASHI